MKNHNAPEHATTGQKQQSQQISASNHPLSEELEEKLAGMDKKHLKELEDSAIDPSIIALNFKSLDGEITEDGTDVADHLLYAGTIERKNTGIVTAKYSRYPDMGAGWWCYGGIDLLTMCPMPDWGCFKPDTPCSRVRWDEAEGKWKPDGGVVKYQHPPEQPTYYFALRVTFAIGRAIALRYGLEDQYAQHQAENALELEAEDKGFWKWAINQKEIPLLITEGAKKAACLLSHGYLAIGLPGIWMGCTSEAGCAVIASGREVVIVFDSDDKESTKKNIEHAAARLAKACKDAGATLVTRVTWTESSKGVDDLITAKGVERFDYYLDDRKEVKELPQNSENSSNDKPCPICTGTDGKCYIPDNKKSVTCGHSSKDVEVEKWKYSKQAKDGRSVFHPVKQATSKDKAAGTEKEKEKSAADQLLEAALSANYFHSPDMRVYADIEIDGSRHTYPVRSTQFRRWLSGEFFDMTGRALNSKTMADGLNMLEMMGSRGELHTVNLRTAEHAGKIYLDLGTPDWQVAEIDELGWRIISSPPVRFWRPSSMLPLPIPVEGGQLSELRELINVDDASWALMVTFILFCYRPKMKYPILEISAHRGSGKTAAAEIIKGLIDPGVGGLMKLPRESVTLGVSLANRWLAVYDNVGFISSDQSDDLCRVATNFSYNARKLFTDDEENIIEVCRPQVITAIDAIVTRDDLADRVLKVQLPEVTPEKRLSQHDLDAKIEESRPRILGALLTALSKTLAELPNAQLKELPRMADYGLFAVAASKAIGLKDGQFMEIFNESREQSRQVVIENSPVGEAIMKLMEKYPVPKAWEGTAERLRLDLQAEVDSSVYNSKYWPKSAQALRRQLNRLIPDLKHVGIEVTDYRSSGKDGTKFIRIEKSVRVVSAKIASNASNASETSQREGFRSDAILTQLDLSDAINKDSSDAIDEDSNSSLDCVRNCVRPESELQQEFQPVSDASDAFDDIFSASPPEPQKEKELEEDLNDLL